MLLISIFQLITFYQIIFTGETANKSAIIVLAAFSVIEWGWAIASSIILKKSSLALECIAFFLTGIGLVIAGSVSTSLMVKQFVAVVLGFISYVVLLFIIADTERAEKFRTPMAVAAIVLLVVTLIFAQNKNGAYNWLVIGGFSIQASELVKGGVQTCALPIFFTFIVIAFLRSGDIRTIIFLCMGAAMIAGLVVLMRSDYVISRFKAYRHIWEYADGRGYQQTRVLTYSASGGLLGLGIGNGELKKVFAATEDLVFGVVCEEWGMLIAFLIALSFIFIFIHSLRCAKGSRSAFYSIASCAAGGLFLFQAALNIFGVTDFLPLTGVTLPFVSRGGSSTISCWALLSFIKAADNRTWAGGKK